MKKKELEYFINNMLINKEDVLLSLRDYIEYCKETKEENWSEKKREIIIKILFNFYNTIKDFDFPVTNSKNWYYEYFWNRDGISLELMYCNELTLDDEGEIDSTSSSNSIIIAEEKCLYLSVEEYAKVYDVKPTTVRQWIRRGKIRNAKKIGRDWLISELADKPQKGYTDVSYFINYLSNEILEKYPYLEKYEKLSISKSNLENDKYEILLSSKREKYPYERMYLNTIEREKLELMLISENEVYVDETFLIMYIPEKRNKYCIKEGEIMLENKIEIYEKSTKKILKNDLKIECDNYLENEDDFLIWNSNIYLKKRIFDDKGDYIDKKLLEIISAKIIPASMDFNDKTSFYSPLDYCDSVSGDMYFSYKAIGDDEGIKEEIVKELEMEEEEVYETSVLYVENVEVKESENLNTFLQAFDIVKEGLPVQYCKLAIFLLEWQKESKKVKVFLENGWKIRNIDSSSVVMYKKI